MRVLQVIVILLSVLLFVTGCENYEVSSLNIEELEKVAEQYFHSADTTDEAQIRPRIESIYSIPKTNRKIVLFRTGYEQCYGFTQLEGKGENKYEFVGGSDISNGPFTGGFIEIDNKTYYVMVIDNKGGEISKVVIKQKSVFSHSFTPQNNLSVSLITVSEKTYNDMSILETEITFFDENGKDISERIKKRFPNTILEGIGG